MPSLKKKCLLWLNNPHLNANERKKRDSNEWRLLLVYTLLITGLHQCRSVSLCRKAACLLGILLKLTCPPGPACQGELDLLLDAHTAVVRTSSFRRGEARLGRQSQARVAEPQRVVRRQRRLEEHLVHGGEVGQESTGSPHVSRTGGVGFPPPRRLPRAVLSSPFVSSQASSHGHGGAGRRGGASGGRRTWGVRCPSCRGGDNLLR